MSIGIEIYAQTHGAGLAAFARDVAEILGAEPKKTSDRSFRFRAPQALCSVIPKIKDGYEDEAFDVEILMDGRDSEEAFVRYATQIFEKLKATKKYPLLMVWDSQRDMARFDPGEDPGPDGTDVDLFIASDRPLAAVAADVCALTGIDLRECSDDPSPVWKGRSYFFADGPRGGQLYAHRLENEAFPFESYRYMLEIYDAAVARNAFDKMKASGKYGLLLVDDLEKKLNEFNPAAAQG